MGCGCGGSGKRGGGSGARTGARASRQVGEAVGPAAPGYTWNGPQVRDDTATTNTPPPKK